MTSHTENLALKKKKKKKDYFHLEEWFTSPDNFTLHRERNGVPMLIGQLFKMSVVRSAR